MKKQTIFISGLAGFLGSHLADLLLAEGHKVIGCDNLTGGDPENVPKDAELLEYDLRDHAKNLKATKHADIVFHAAATAYDGFSLFSPFHITDNIYSASASLMSASVENKVRRFVYCSSMARYGEQSSPFVENMATRPVTPYGIAKVAAENLLRNLCETHGMEYVICVPHNIIGPRQKYDDPYRNVAAIMINRMIQGLPPIIYGDGQQKRCFSDIRDTLQVFEHLLFSSSAQGQVINVGPDEEFISIRQLAETLAELLGQAFEPRYVEARPNEVFFANCSADKARNLFHYQTRFSIKESLSEMVTWIQKKGPKPFQYHLPLEIHNARTPRTWVEREI